LHPKEAQDYISRAWSKQSTSRLFYFWVLASLISKIPDQIPASHPSPVPDLKPKKMWRM
jgi:hypothetical protein